MNPLESLMADTGLTQQQLARMLGTSQALVSYQLHYLKNLQPQQQLACLTLSSYCRESPAAWQQPLWAETADWLAVQLKDAQARLGLLEKKAIQSLKKLEKLNRQALLFEKLCHCSSGFCCTTDWAQRQHKNLLLQIKIGWHRQYLPALLAAKKQEALVQGWTQLHCEALAAAAAPADCDRQAPVT